MTKVAEACMPMDDLDLLANDDVSEDGKEGEDCRKSRFPVDDKEGNVVDFETICKISNSGTALICMRDDDDFVSAIN